MIACKQCGARHFEAEKEFAELAAIFRVILIQKHGAQGHLLIGTGPTGTMEWAREHVQYRIEHGDGGIALRWDSAALKPEGV